MVDLLNFASDSIYVRAQLSTLKMNAFYIGAWLHTVALQIYVIQTCKVSKIRKSYREIPCENLHVRS